MYKDIINTLIHTEKSTVQEEKGKFLFWVKKAATKPQIKKAVEDIYKVSVTKVNTCIVPAKAKRVRQQLGYTSDWKKAVVTLKEGQKIEIK
ncbi:MAG: 50S ribosomal protein L23 [Candidatus Omnitrophica bacterium]|nr:50S ribosomal protein L23 [Candidatus Omnitrophota bacterium]MDD5352203.1 50S ribosomal protein L23 [Candidatus Omnitrophota bacterium]MDD5549801.1 50S ribosomal protein L23 [Candidatus Omnitrophota bacterium]